MNGRICAVVLFTALLLAGPPARADEVRPAAPKPLPALSFTDEDGHPLDMAAFKGKVVVLDYWATWCAPCKSEFPLLDKLQSRLSDKGLVVVPVSVDRKGKPVVERFYDELQVGHLGKFLDPTGKSAQALGIQGLPTTLIIDREGREVVRVEGEAAWDGPEIGGILDRLLAGS